MNIHDSLQLETCFYIFQIMKKDIKRLFLKAEPIIFNLIFLEFEILFTVSSFVGNPVYEILCQTKGFKCIVINWLCHSTYGRSHEIKLKDTVLPNNRKVQKKKLQKNINF